MKAMALPQNLVFERTHDDNSVLCRRQKRWTAILFISAALGVFSGFAGFLIGLLSALGVTMPHVALSSLGTCLLVASFPLLMLAAHCLDKVGEIEKAMRIGYCRKHGMTD